MHGHAPGQFVQGIVHLPLDGDQNTDLSTPVHIGANRAGIEMDAVKAPNLDVFPQGGDQLRQGLGHCAVGIERQSPQGLEIGRGGFHDQF